MIEIDLLPQELKIKNAGPHMAPVNLLYIVPAIFGLLVVVHVYLAAATVISGYRFGVLSRKWKEVEPQRRIVDAANKEYAGLTQDAVFLKQMLNERQSWARKLNRLCLDLPSGIWLNELKLTGKDFTLKGSVFSLTHQEVGQINKFLDSLINDQDFFGGFSGLQLGPVQKASVASYEVADFTLNGKLK